MRLANQVAYIRSCYQFQGTTGHYRERRASHIRSDRGKSISNPTCTLTLGAAQRAQACTTLNIIGCSMDRSTAPPQIQEIPSMVAIRNAAMSGENRFRKDKLVGSGVNRALSRSHRGGQ